MIKNKKNSLKKHVHFETEDYPLKKLVKFENNEAPFDKKEKNEKTFGFSTEDRNLCIQKRITKKFKDGEINDTFKMINNFDQKFLQKVLSYDRYILFSMIHNYLDYHSFIELITLMKEENIKEMAISKNGQLFRSIIIQILRKNFKKKKIQKIFPKNLNFS